MQRQCVKLTIATATIAPNTIKAFIFTSREVYGTTFKSLEKKTQTIKCKTVSLKLYSSPARFKY